MVVVAPQNLCVSELWHVCFFFSFQPLTEFKFSHGLGRVGESGSDIRSSPRRLESPVVNVPRSKEQREMQGRGCQVGGADRV